MTSHNLFPNVGFANVPVGGGFDRTAQIKEAIREMRRNGTWRTSPGVYARLKARLKKIHGWTLTCG